MIRNRLRTGIPHDWVVIGLCVSAITPLAMITLGVGALYPFIQEDLGTSRAELGLFTSGRHIGGITTSVFVGWLADAMGARRLETAALVVGAVGILLFSQMQSVLQGFLLSAVIGIAISASLPAYIKAIMDWVALRNRGLAIGIAEASLPVGGIIAAGLFTSLALTSSWRIALIVLAVIVALSSMLFFAFYRDKPHSADTQADVGNRLSGRVALVAKNRDIWLVSIFGAAISSLMFVFLSFLILFLKEELGMSAAKAGGMMAIALGGGAVGRVAWGLASDLPLRGRRAMAISLVGVMAVLSTLALTWLPSDTPIVVVIFVVGSNILGWTGLWSLLLAELAGPDLTGTAIGFAAMVMRVGAFGFTPLFGLIVDRTGSYDMGWWLMAGVAGMGTLMMAFLRPQSRRR